VLPGSERAEPAAEGAQEAAAQAGDAVVHDNDHMHATIANAGIRIRQDARAATAKTTTNGSQHDVLPSVSLSDQLRLGQFREKVVIKDNYHSTKAGQELIANRMRLSVGG
jgi:hypothetical protein